MDDTLEQAERNLAEANTQLDIKKAMIGYLMEIFKDRPATRAHMGQIMMVTLDHADTLEKKRNAVRMLVRTIHAEVKSRGR